MKVLKRVIAVCLVIMVVMTSLPNDMSAATKLKINKTNVVLIKGQSTQLKLNIKGKIKWSSSNKKVATVSNTGKVTAKEKGKAIITATIGKEKLKCSVSIKSKSCSSIAQIIKDAGLITGTKYVPTYNLVGAEDGIKYVSADGENIEIYKFNKTSSAYKNIVQTKKMTIAIFGATLKVAAVKDGYVLYLNGFDRTTQKKIIGLFKQL